jgi:hypothetical protein
MDEVKTIQDILYFLKKKKLSMNVSIEKGCTYVHLEPNQFDDSYSCSQVRGTDEQALLKAFNKCNKYYCRN